MNFFLLAGIAVIALVIAGILIGSLLFWPALMAWQLRRRQEKHGQFLLLLLGIILFRGIGWYLRGRLVASYPHNNGTFDEALPLHWNLVWLALEAAFYASLYLIIRRKGWILRISAIVLAHLLSFLLALSSALWSSVWILIPGATILYLAWTPSWLLFSVAAIGCMLFFWMLYLFIQKLKQELQV